MLALKVRTNGEEELDWDGEKGDETKEGV